MTAATLSSKGQITLPAAARRMLNLRAGDRIVIETHDEHIVIRRAQDFLSWKGRLGKAQPREQERHDMQREAARAGQEGSD